MASLLSYELLAVVMVYNLSHKRKLERCGVPVCLYRVNSMDLTWDSPQVSVKQLGNLEINHGDRRAIVEVTG
jgi:hypothetical protein